MSPEKLSALNLLLGIHVGGGEDKGRRPQCQQGVISPQYFMSVLNILYNIYIVFLLES